MTEIYQSLIIREKHKLRVNALIDTGATTTYIRPDIARKIGTEKLKKVKVTLADGKEIIGWETSFLIEVYGISDGIKGTITNIDEPLIIGVDFLQRRNIILNFKTHKMKIKRLSIRKGYRL